MSQDQPFIQKSSLGGPVIWVGQSKLGAVESGRIYKAGQTLLARLMEPQIQHQPVWLCSGRAQKRDNDLCSH